MYTVILRASTKNTRQRKMVKNSKDKSKWNTKIYSNNPQKDKKRNRNKKEGTKKKRKHKMADLNPNTSKIILNKSGLDTAINRQILSEWGKKDYTICPL